MLSPKAELRRLTLNDAAGGELLSRQIGWSHTTSTWERLIRWGGDGSFCIAEGHKLLATTIALAYSPRLAWIGVVITHPDFRRQGLGKQLMAAAMNYLAEQQVNCIMLDATDLGHPLYQQFGFRDLYKIENWETQSPVEGIQPMIRKMGETDLSDVITLDARIFGVERPQVIRELAATGLCWVDDSSGHLDGYIMAQVNQHGRRIGPWYHRTPAGAEKLLTGMLSKTGIHPVRVQMPETNVHARSILERYGFKQANSITRMVYGSEPPGNMDCQYSIAAAATG